MKAELEICCADADSVVTAAEAGAKRIELCSALGEGGVTPSEGLIRLAVVSGIPSVNVLIRPRGGDFIYSPAEVSVMLDDIRRAIELGASGIVIGALTPEGMIDMDIMKRLVSVIRETGGGNTEIIFHRAFDRSKESDIPQNLEALESLGVNRILTSGLAATAEAGIPVLKKLREMAPKNMKIMAGSGVSADNALEILENSGVDALHASASDKLESQMTYRNQAVSMGTPGSDEYTRRTSSSTKVHRLMEVLAALLILLLTPALQAGNTYDRDALLQSLYSGMSTADSLSYSREFFADNVDASLRARREMPWGMKVPDKEFLHFVLPVRVNNEALDTARRAFYRELAPRVRNMNMEQAALEVNHWCHEKVTYRPSDGRTSSPLSAVSQAIGRCGEESTFTVAALRSVGIPARQIYTPRWAHTDDNHAWVEVWTDGKWHFLGACEPEPMLDIAWFNQSASRGMMMNTKVPGQYPGPEEILERTPISTTINVTSNYAPTRTVSVIVTDAAGKPIPGATVDFCLYNYAEFYKLATKKTDSNGRATLLAGVGDLMVWASDNGRYAYAVASPKQEGDLTLRIPDSAPAPHSFSLDLVPPAVSGSVPRPTAEQAAENVRRLAYEDSIRNAYTATFMTAEEGAALARRLNMPDGLADLLVKSRGNHKRLADFLTSLTPAQRNIAWHFLTAITEKDLRDVETAVLLDNILYSTQPSKDIPSEIADKYMLSPRVGTEPLRPYKEFFSKNIGKKEKALWHKDPTKLAAWISKNISTESRNPAMLPEDPVAAYASRIADSSNLPLLYVAMARSCGIPARVDAVTGKTQYYNNGWHDISWEKKVSASAKAAPKGGVKFIYEPTTRIPDPAYYTNYTISAIKDGRLRLMEYDDFMPLSEFKGENAQLDAGDYLLVTGQRLADGTVLCKGEIFNISPEKVTEVPLEIRHDDTALQVIGSLNAEDLYHDIALDEDRSILSTTGRGYYALCILRPGHEPSAHAINDIAAAAQRVKDTGRTILLLFESPEEYARFDRSLFPELPENVRFGIDIDGKIVKEIEESLHIPNADRPLFVVADTFNRIVFVSSGYTIHLGDTLADVFSRL